MNFLSFTTNYQNKKYMASFGLSLFLTNYYRFCYILTNSIIYIIILFFGISYLSAAQNNILEKNTEDSTVKKNKEKYPQILNNSKEIINILCSPKMQGRGYANKGEKIAANYIANQFSSIGLLKYKGSYFQSFNLKSVNTFPKKVQLKSKNNRFKAGKDFLITSFSNSGKGKVDILYLDSAFFESDSTQMAFRKISLKKNAVMYSDKWSKKIQLENSAFLEKIQEAKGVFVRTEKLVGVPSPIAYSKPYFEVLDSVFPLYPALDMVDLQDLKAAKKANKIQTVKFKVKSKLLEGQPSQNVIGYIKGTKNPKKVIVFSAHYDHLGKMGKNVHFAGANDNASGVAMLLELAKYYTKNPPEYSIAFMAFGSEEIGVLGHQM